MHDSKSKFAKGSEKVSVYQKCFEVAPELNVLIPSQESYELSTVRLHG